MKGQDGSTTNVPPITFRFVGGPSRKRRKNRPKTVPKPTEPTKPLKTAPVEPLVYDLGKGFKDKQRTPNPLSPLSASGSIDEADIESEPSVEDSTEVDLDKLKFINEPQVERAITDSAHCMYIGSRLSNINYLLRLRLGEKMSEQSHYATRKMLREPDSVPQEALELPPKDTVDDLLHAYFRNINPTFPVVDENLFMKQYEGRNPRDRPSLLLLNAMMVVGAHTSYSDHAERDRMKQAFFQRAKSLVFANFEQNLDVVVQACLLLTWYEGDSFDSWYWVGLATRMAMEIGMNRDIEHSGLVPNKKRMWRRVWWLLVQSDVLISLQHGRPLAINLAADCSVQSLEKSDFADCGADTRVDYVIQLTKLCVQLDDVIQEQFHDEVFSDGERFQAIDDDLADWYMHLPPSLQLRDVTSEGLADAWTGVLHVIYNMVLILLHRPQNNTLSLTKTDVLSQKQNQRLMGDAQVCTNAATAIQQIFRAIYESGKFKLLWAPLSNCLFTALIHLSLEARMANPVLTIYSLERNDSALESLKELSLYWPKVRSIASFFENYIDSTDGHLIKG